MASKLAKAVAVGDPKRMLRPHWEELIRRVWARRFTDILYSRKIISAMDREEVESKAVVSRREGAKLLLEIMLTRSWEKCFEFAVIVSETEGVEDLGKKLLEDAGWLHVQLHVVVTRWCDYLLLDVGDEDMIDGRDRRRIVRIVREIRQLKRDKEELVEKNRSLMKENGKLVVKNRSLTKEKKELKGDRLLRIGYEMKEGGGERVSVV